MKTPTPAECRPGWRFVRKSSLSEARDELDRLFRWHSNDGEYSSFDNHACSESLLSLDQAQCHVNQLEFAALAKRQKSIGIDLGGVKADVSSIQQALLMLVPDNKKKDMEALFRKG